MLVLLCYTGEQSQMNKDDDDYDYLVMSVRDSLSLMLWTSLSTIIAVGIILALAL